MYFAKRRPGETPSPEWKQALVVANSGNALQFFTFTFLIVIVFTTFSGNIYKLFGTILWH